MQLNGMVLLDHCILMNSITRFTGDIPKTFNKHFYYRILLKAVRNYACTYLQDCDLKLWQDLLKPVQSLSQCPT